MTEEERQDQAGEYVLGTLTAEERAAFERVLVSDPALQAQVRFWEAQMISLTDMIPEVAPSARVWRNIERAIGPETVPVAPTAANDDLRLLRRSRARWRGIAATAGAIAAGLGLFVGLGRFEQPGASYLAVVNRGGELPALVVAVDTRAGLVTVRSLAAERPANRSLQLWYIAAAGGAPRSLGLVDQPRRQEPLPAVARGDLAGGTIAVSVEPEGGSTTGGPTGPVIYSGKLIQE